MTRPTWTRRCPRKSGWYFVFWDGDTHAQQAQVHHPEVYVSGRWWNRYECMGRLWFWPTPIRLPKVGKQR